MEVKINREIREYTESMFFGLSLRQFVFSILACLVAVITYFLLKAIVGLETVSWLCILVAIPFAVLGFLKYNGMHAEEFIWAWIKSELLIPKKLRFSGRTVYWHVLREAHLEDKRNRRLTVRLANKLGFGKRKSKVKDKPEETNRRGKRRKRK